MAYVITIVILPFAVAYIIVVVMRRWYWVLAAALALVVILAIVHQASLRSESLQGESQIDRDWIIYTAYFVAAAVLTRLLTLWLEPRGWPPLWRNAIHVAGFFIVPALVFGNSAVHDWQHRGPDEACARSVHPVEFGTTKIYLKALPALTLYLGPSVRADAFYLSLGSFVRQLCAKTKNGVTPVRATLLGVANDKPPGQYQRHHCPVNNPRGLPKSACDTLGAEQKELLSELRMPQGAKIFDITHTHSPGEFGGARSTYAESQKAPANDRYTFVVSSNWLTADGKPWAAKCQPPSNGAAERYCSTSFLWQHGLHLSFYVRATLSDVEASAQQTEAALRKIFTTLQQPPK